MPKRYVVGYLSLIVGLSCTLSACGGSPSEQEEKTGEVGQASVTCVGAPTPNSDQTFNSSGTVNSNSYAGTATSLTTWVSMEVNGVISESNEGITVEYDDALGSCSGFASGQLHISAEVLAYSTGFACWYVEFVEKQSDGSTDGSGNCVAPANIFWNYNPGTTGLDTMVLANAWRTGVGPAEKKVESTLGWRDL